MQPNICFLEFALDIENNINEKENKKEQSYKYIIVNKCIILDTKESLF